MTLPRALSLFLALLLPALAPAAPVTNGSVTVELVAHDSSIQPGQPIWVALKMDHDLLWHSYWINAGTGYPTSINWTLPDGFTAGPIVWATPHVVKDTSGKVTGNGYEDQVFHFVRITPPASLAPGASVTLKARAEWLMCKDVCMPGEADLELTLPVKAGKPEPNMRIARLFNNAFHDLPRAESDWRFTAVRGGGKVTLTLTPAPGKTPPAPSELHYFDENAVIDYAAPQFVRAAGQGYEIELAVGSDAPADAKGLKGILTGKNLTGPVSGYGGVHVDVPFGTATAAKAPPASAPSGPAAPEAATAGGDAAGAQGGLGGALLLAVLGGLILNLMPCVFPVIGIKILGFVNQSGQDRGKVASHGLVYSAGVLVSFWILAGVILALRAAGQELGWGAQLQIPGFVFGMAAFLLVFALNLSGLFEIGLSATGVGAGLQAKEGLSGSFFTGALAVLVATPCSAPFLAPALGAAFSTTYTAAEAMGIFTAIAVGLALPYLLLSLFPQAIRLLPRPGAWMETFKQFMAFPLYATVGWMLWILAAQTSQSDNAFLLIAFAFVLIAMAAWFYGRFGQAHGGGARRAFGRIAALVLVVAGLALGWPSAPSAAEIAGAANGAADGVTPGYKVEWQKWSPEAVAAAQADGKFAYVDFTARWCFTCQTNKAAVFASDAVLAEFQRKDVVLFKADWTNRDPKITAELAKWKRAAVPFNLIYAPGKKDPIVLPEILTPGRVLEALEHAAQPAGAVAAR
ncbi:MAG TPA: thioredoxin family protein [Opitutaceae bacterium]|nr:thioredoxin family protein [Opitutaceae bacterium]